MTEKTKKALVIAASVTLCVALAIGIAVRFTENTSNPELAADNRISAEKEPELSAELTVSEKPTVTVIPKASPSPSVKVSDPGAGAVSTGTEQAIQADPIRPVTPDAPAAPSVVVAVPNPTQPEDASVPYESAMLPEDHTADDVPESERNLENPPEYVEIPVITPAPAEPDAGTSNNAGEVYVPGFGYVTSQGVGSVVNDNEIYENGNKVGIMG